jgi:hypothetical protein
MVDICLANTKPKLRRKEILRRKADRKKGVKEKKRGKMEDKRFLTFLYFHLLTSSLTLPLIYLLLL